MPTSGDLKSGDALLHYPPTPLSMNVNAPPLPPLANYDMETDFSLYMKSYMRYILSKFVFIIVTIK